MKNRFWATDWFAGVVIVIVAVLFSLGDSFSRIELSAYDIGVRASSRDPGKEIAIIGIDDQSIANLGRWPWARDVHAAMIEKLHNAGAKVIGFTVLVSEAQQDAGLAHIRDMRKFYGDNHLNDPAVVKGPLAPPLIELGARLDRAESSLDTDTKLATAIKGAGGVVLGMQMIPGKQNGNPDTAVPEWLMREALPEDNMDFGDANDLPLPMQTISIAPPIEKLAVESRSVGHLVTLLDDDGKVRMEPLMLEYFGSLFPSMSLQIAAASLNLSIKDVRVILGEGVQVGQLSIKTDPKLRMRSFFYADTYDGPAFPVDSFYDVYTGKIDLSKYKGKIVLIGPTAFGLGSSLTTPLPGAVQPVQVLAHNVASILNEDFYVVPSYAPIAKWLALLVIAAYLMFLLPRLGAAMGAGISALLLIVLFGVEIGMLTGSGSWLPLMLPMFTLATGHLALTTRRFLVTERGKHKSDTESAESNRMLGLAFQQAGQLDMALEKFRRVPLRDDMMDPLYNLALDFERKRQFSKAAAIYEYMAGHDAAFKDIATRKDRASAAQDSMIFGLRSGGSGGGDTLMASSIGEKPKLGRYEIEKELGRGAMGVVYLGVDPRINRTVAIKTLSLASEFDESELAEVKERFFREAEAAGRLNHPNIVTIYDTGEEHDLSWIAMELLTGQDLTRCVKPENVLPIQTVISVIARAAEGLDYAHSQNVIHRDIKPANIMYDPEADTVKIADFGIARISGSGKTKTGMVVGTPSFMSPEQVTGRKDLDGRTDLFSLGVALYQLVTLQLPFDGDQATQIMYKIATEPYPDPLEARPDLKKTCPWISVVIKRALEKDRDKRYQTGGQMAKDLRACLVKMNELAKKNAAGGAEAAPAGQ